MRGSILKNPEGQADRSQERNRLALFFERWQEPVAVFLGFRVGLGLLAFFAGIMFPAVVRGGTAPYSPAALSRWGDRLLGVWSHWDGEWYLHIAQNGYQPEDGTSAFFPLYPLLLKILGFLLGGNFLLAGVLLSSIAALACLILLYELVVHEGGRALAWRACFYLTAFPTAFFLIAIYNESLFLALVLGMFLAARRYQKWSTAGLLAAFAVLTRSLGILLLLPLVWEWLRQQEAVLTLPLVKKFNQKNFASSRDTCSPDIVQTGPKKPEHSSFAEGREKTAQNIKPVISFLLLILPPVLALAGWIGFNALVLGDPLNFVKIQNNPVWNRHNAMPWDTVWRGIQVFFNSRGPDGFLPSLPREDPNLIDFPFFVFLSLLFLAACWESWRGRFPLSYLLYFGVGLLLPLLSPAAKQPLLSFPRFGLVLFPAFILLAHWGERWRWFHFLYLYSSLLLLGLFFSRFANWYWIA